MLSGNLLRILGDELRAARTRRRWTRPDVLRRLASPISEPTLATYEYGSRSLSVLRFVELCHVLGLFAPDVLARCMRRAAGLPVDLHTAARVTRPELSPLRRWAQARLRFTRPGKPIVALLDPAAVARLAELCGMPAADLASALRTMT